MDSVQLCWEEIKPTLVTKLGQGSFGQVYEGWYHSAPMAVKIINVDRCTGLSMLPSPLLFLCHQHLVSLRTLLHASGAFGLLVRFVFVSKDPCMAESGLHVHCLQSTLSV